MCFECRITRSYRHALRIRNTSCPYNASVVTRTRINISFIRTLPAFLHSNSRYVANMAATPVIFVVLSELVLQECFPYYKMLFKCIIALTSSVLNS